MITFWNRKEIYNGLSLKEFNKIKGLLISKDIKYRTKVVNRQNSKFFGPSRSYGGSFGERTELTYTYYIYIHKNDYDSAKYLLSQTL